MTAPFDFATAGRILFGPGKSSELAAAARSFGRRALLVTGANLERFAALSRQLPDPITLAVSGEPDVALVRRGSALARAEQCDHVVAIGGGSAIDAGKAIAALVANSGEPSDYLEVVGRGLPLERAPLPFIAVPTTAGTGSEATRNAVLSVPGHRLKASLRAASMLPKLAIVDPELMLGLPPAVTAATGLDALTQLIEPFVSHRATPFTDALCLDGIRRSAPALRRAFRNGNDLEARTDMALASLYGGIALANAGLGAVHGFAAPIGGMFPAPHGAVCAALLPHATAANIRALRERAPQSDALRRYAIIAGDVVQWTRSLAAELEIPPLRIYGVTAGDVPGICAKAAHASSMKANPIQLSAAELAEILLAALP